MDNSIEPTRAASRRSNRVGAAVVSISDVHPPWHWPRMNRSDLIQAVQGVARPVGCRRKGNLLWTSGDELTTLIYVQSSRWGKGVYVNFGVTPNAMITKDVPPGAGCWGWNRRAERLDGPFRELFWQMAMDDEDAMRAADMTDAVRWLVAWIEENFADAAAVRKTVLDEIDQAAHAGVERGAGFIMDDWARGELKEPTRYFKNTSYDR